jgi:DNA-binding transcriptional LysR family regulator
MEWSAPLEAFVATAEARSFREAARRLGKNPASVSKAIARLEQDLGLILLERTTRRVELTPAGHHLLRHARAALDELRDGLQAAASTLDHARGRARISASPVLAEVLVGVLPQLAADHPDVEVDLRFSDAPVDLLAGDVDVAVRIGPLADSSLVAIRLGELRWRTVASPAYLERAGTPVVPSDLADHRCLRFVRPTGALADWWFEAPGENPGTVRVPSHLRVDAGLALVAAARAGLGIAQVFDLLVRPDLAAGTLVAVLEPFAAPGPRVSALVLPTRQDLPHVRAVLTALAGLFPAPTAGRSRV